MAPSWANNDARYTHTECLKTDAYGLNEMTEWDG